MLGTSHLPEIQEIPPHLCGLVSNKYCYFSKEFTKNSEPPNMFSLDSNMKTQTHF